MSHPFLSYCSPATCLSATGDDAGSFLQGQFSNQLNVPIGRSVYGLWLTPKGKVLADSFVLKLDENKFLIVSMGSSVEVIRGRLEAYVIADDVLFTDNTGSWGGFAVVADKDAALLRSVFGSCPDAGKFIRSGDLYIFPTRGSAGSNYEVVGPLADVETCKARLTLAGATEVSSAVMETIRIEAGIPKVPTDIGPDDLPNEGGLEEVAISYTKGCYLGQEVMARLKNLGQVRRRLLRVKGAGGSPSPLAPLFQSGERVGELRSVAKSMGGEGFVAFAMLSLVKYRPGLDLSFSPSGPVAMEVLT